MIPTSIAPRGPRLGTRPGSDGSPAIDGRTDRDERLLSSAASRSDRPSAVTAPPSDEQLVALVRRGEQSAFDTLAARYQARLLFFCWQMLRSREDAEDALQEVFAAAFHAILADDREIQLRPWLYRIARNRCLNHLRRTTTVGHDSLDALCAEDGRTVVDTVVNRQEFRELVSDVQALPGAQRTALLLREIDGFTYKDIADAMETTVPSVKSLLVRARVGLVGSAAVRDTPPPARREPQRRSSRARPRRNSRAVSYQTARAAASAASAASGAGTAAA